MINIEDNSAFVEQEEPCKDKTIIESTAGNSDVSNSSPETTNDQPDLKPTIRMQRLTSEMLGLPLSVDEIKQRVSYQARLKADGHKIQNGGCQAKCRCPFHDDSTPSFVLSAKDDYGYCFGCAWKGDIIQYEQDYHHLDWLSALENLSKWLENGSDIERSIVAPIEEVTFQISEDQREIMLKASADLLADDALIGKIAADRKWLPETIAKLASDGDLGLSEGQLAFNYSTGQKLRAWPAKEFRWNFGKNGLWRDRLIESARTIYLTEGETDAISLLDCGLEQHEGNAVIAVPGVNGFKQAWADRFKDKAVVICFDNDEAGKEGAKRVQQMLTTVAREVRTWTPKEGK